MERFRQLLLLIVMFCVGGAAPAIGGTTTAGTAPTIAPVEMLDQGRVRITPPAGWMLTERRGDGLGLRYILNDGEGAMSLIVTPQDATIGRKAVAKMTKTIGKELREAARNAGAHFLIPPRVERDDRFLLKIRDRTRGADEKARDQLQLYRAMNLELVHVAVVATVETEEQSQPIFAAAEELLERATLGAGPKPSAFRKTRVRLTVPSDWIEQHTDDPNGVVATYTNPAVPGARLVVRSRIIPKDAKRNPQVREHALDALVDGYRNAALPEGAAYASEERKLDHPVFNRYLQRSLTWNDQPWGTDFRCVVVGDVAIGVEALVPPLDTQITRLADRMTASIRSLDDRRRVSDFELSPAVAPALRQKPRPSTAPSTTPATAPARAGSSTTAPTRTTDTGTAGRPRR